MLSNILRFFKGAVAIFTHWFAFNAGKRTQREKMLIKERRKALREAQRWRDRPRDRDELAERVRNGR